MHLGVAREKLQQLTCYPANPAASQSQICQIYLLPSPLLNAQMVDARVENGERWDARDARGHGIGYPSPSRANRAARGSSSNRPLNRNCHWTL